MSLFVVPPSKSRLLTCLIGNKALLCTQCRGIGPYLSARGKYHGFSRVAAGTWLHSRVTAGVAIKNFSFFSDVKSPL